MLRAEQRHGAGGGLALLLRRHHGPWCSATAWTVAPCEEVLAPEHSTICTTLADTGWKAGGGRKARVDAREIGLSDLVVIWGGNPVATQVNVMTHMAKARKQRGAPAGGDRPLPHRHAHSRPTCTSGPTARQRRGAGRRRHPHAAGAKASPTGTIWRASPIGIAEVGGALRRLHSRPGRRRSPALTVEEITAFARPLRRPQAAVLSGSATAFPARAMALPNVHAVTCLPTVITGAWQHEGGGALYGQTQLYPSGSKPDRGPRCLGSFGAGARSVPPGADPDR